MVILYGIVAGLLSLATPLAIQVLINWLAFGALLQPVVVLGATLSVCLGLAAALQLLQRLGVETIERRLFVRTVADLAAGSPGSGSRRWTGRAVLSWRTGSSTC